MLCTTVLQYNAILASFALVLVRTSFQHSIMNTKSCSCSCSSSCSFHFSVIFPVVFQFNARVSNELPMRYKLKIRIFVISFWITCTFAFARLSSNMGGNRIDGNSFTSFQGSGISTAGKKVISLQAVSSPAISAASGLIVSSLLASISEEIFPQNTGIMVALIVSSIFSNLRWVPTEHVFYDLCWSLFLPASLFLLLIQGSNGEVFDSNTAESSVKSDIAPVGLAFLISTMGSFLGCVVSFLLSRSGFLLSPCDAVTAGASLVATYVGGSINFFSTARILSMRSSLLSAMAGAELIMMALYFLFLNSAISNPRLLKFFNDDDIDKTQIQANSTALVEVKDHEDGKTIPMKVVSTCSVLAMACVVAKGSSLIERALNHLIPGTACGAIALFAVATRKLTKTSRNKYWYCMKQAAPPVANFSYLLFFASIGVTANLGHALKSGPACILFSAIALVVHIVISLFGCVWWNKLHKGKPLRLRHALVASNAAIGGPATAAAFASQQNLGLASAATLWGTVGYSVGTNLGVLTSKVLSNFL